ncbi:MAG: hypothetical protein JSS23_03275 [Proteobacteria bacterium]|nr:hypothetical protein [Pseudomonadota bacterium]
MSQPPHYGRVGAQHERPARDAVQYDAKRAIDASHSERWHKTRKHGLRAVVRG